MRLRVLGYALVAGVAAFLVVGAAVAELLSSRIEFSVLVGIPAGLVAGTVTAAFVLYRLGRRTDPAGRALALALVAFGGVLLVVAVAASALPSIGLGTALVVAAVAGIAGGIGVFVRERRRASPER